MSASTFEMNLDRSLERRERRPDEWIGNPHERNSLKPMGLPRWLLASLLRRWADEAERYGEGGALSLLFIEEPPYLASCWAGPANLRLSLAAAVFWFRLLSVVTEGRRQPELIDRLRLNAFRLPSRQPRLPLPLRMALHWFMDGCKVPHWST